MNFLNIGNIKLRLKKREPDLIVLDLILCNINKEYKDKIFSKEFITTLTDNQISKKVGHKVLSKEAEEIFSRLSKDYIEWKMKYGHGKIPVIKSFRVESCHNNSNCYKAIITISSQVRTILNYFYGTQNMPKEPLD